MNASDQLKDIFAEAMAQTADQLPAFLDRACNGDAELRGQVLKLLDSHRQAAGFLRDATRQAPDAPTEAPELVGTRIGPYKLLQLIGEGGFGNVFMAEQEHPVRRRVALKVIKLGMDTRHVIARFEAERQALAMMDHPHIAKVFDAGATERGRPYFVMELVRGEPITVFCDRNRLTIEQRLGLFCNVCEAVQHAHTKGIIHRDLKPSNALVTIGDYGPVPKVIDFGIAKATSAAGGRLTDKTLFTEFRQLIGTPEYMSPEQAESSAIDVDTRTDVYSLGVLLYELLTGATPFDAGHLRSVALGELQRIIREDDPPRPSTKLSSLHTLPSVATQRGVEPKRLASQLRGELDWIVMKCIEKDRARRYETAAALSADVRRYLAGEPVSAVPPTLAYRARKFIRRHRVATLAALLVGLALIVGAAGTTIGMLRARESEAGAKAVNAFMVQVLTSVDPDAGGRDVRLVDVLDEASRSATQRFKGHPLLEVEVRHLLARAYNRLSMSAPSRAERRQALDVMTRAFGPDDRRTLATHVVYASHFLNDDDVRQAEAMHADLLPRVERAFDAGEPISIDLQRQVGMVHLLRGRYDQAEQTLNRARSMAVGGRTNDELQIAILEGLIRIAKSRIWDVDREDRPAMIDAMEPLAREAADLNLALHGPESLDSLTAQVRLAEVVNLQGGHREAAETCRAILATSTERLGECHDVREHAMEVLAHATARLGDAQPAADLVLQRLECVRRNQAGKYSPTVLGAMSDSLRFLDRAGRGPEGEAIAREFSAQVRALGGGHDSMAFEPDVYAAKFVSMQGRLDEADAMFAALLNQTTDPIDDFTSARLLMSHASHLVRRGRFAEAEQQLQQAVKMIGDMRAGTWDTHPDDVIVEFIALYEAWRKPVELETYRRLQAEVTGLPMKAATP